MADVLIKQLNDRIATTIGKNKPAGVGGEAGGAVSKFDQVLTNKLDSTQMLKKMSDAIGGESITKSNMNSISASDIKINVQQGEFGKERTFDGKKAVSDLFSTLNNDSLKMDSVIEVLSSSDTKLTRRQLLAYQYTMSNISLTTEMCSKMASSLSQNLNTLLQTNFA